MLPVIDDYKLWDVSTLSSNRVQVKCWPFVRIALKAGILQITSHLKCPICHQCPEKLQSLQRKPPKQLVVKEGSGEDVVVAVHVAEQIQIKESYPTPPHLEIRKEENNSQKPLPGEVSLWCPKPQREAWVFIFFTAYVSIFNPLLSVIGLDDGLKTFLWGTSHLMV